MKLKRLSKDQLEDLVINEKLEVELPDADAVRNARSNACMAGKKLGYKFSLVVGENNSITVTRIQ